MAYLNHTHYKPVNMRTDDNEVELSVPGGEKSSHKCKVEKVAMLSIFPQPNPHPDCRQVSFFLFLDNVLLCRMDCVTYSA